MQGEVWSGGSKRRVGDALKGLPVGGIIGARCGPLESERVEAGGGGGVGSLGSSVGCV
jgi:hypothetical protein